MDTIASELDHGGTVTERYVVQGMTCESCVHHVAAALATVPGVTSAWVDLASTTATVHLVPGPDRFEALQQAVSEAGYTLAREHTPEPAAIELPVKPVLFGLLAAAALVAFYLGVITLAQDWSHAVQQLAEDRWFVGAITAGFGTQVGLFTYLRDLHARAGAGGMAVSTGTSTVAMLACCAHHLTDLLPIIGLSGAVVFLNVYKTPLLWLGILMNLAGIGYMLWQVRKTKTERWIYR